MEAFLSARIFFFALFLALSPLAQALEPKLELVQGQWLTTGELPNGAKLETKDSLNSDGSFTGTGTVDAKPFWSYSGTWHLSGSKMTMTFLNSSLPLPEAAKVSVNEILSVSESELVLKSEEDGKQLTLHRIKDIPKIVVEKNGIFTNITSEGNLASYQAVGCIPLTEAKNIFTPADLHKGLAECVKQESYDIAARLYLLASAYGVFDAQRITDKTAGQAILALNMNTFSNVPQDKKAKVEGAIKRIAADRESLGKFCDEIIKIGAPNYYPSYMIQHGVKAFTGNSDDNALIKDFDAVGVWKKTLANNLKCSI